MQSYHAGCSEKRHSEILKTNCQHVARHISDWIKSEELRAFDIQHHHYLVKCFAMIAQERAQMREQINRAEDAMAVSLDDFTDLQQAVGDDIDDAIDEGVGDNTEPTESQKRELLKIHRNLGHTSPRDLAHALKHVGAKRHLILWALKELRCPVCKSRVRPDTRRPGVLPRSMKFN